MRGLFQGASFFQSDLSRWETSRVTDLSWAFSGTQEFNSDLSGWDTSSVEDMSALFFVTVAFVRK
jgi:surface protein